MKNLLQKLKKDVSEAPVIFKFDKDDKWFEFHLSLTPDGKLNLFYLRNPTFWKLAGEDASITVAEAFKTHKNHYKDLETFERIYYKLYGKEPPIYIAEEVMESVRNKIRNIGYNKFAAFINSIFPSSKMTAPKVKQLLDDLENTLDIVAAFVILYSLNYPTYKVSKKLPTVLSSSIGKLLTSDSSSIVVKEPYSNKRVEISMNKITLPTKWGADERILLYDVILREYSMNPRNKIVLVRGRHKLHLPNEAKKEVILISPARIKKLTQLGKYAASRILDKFPNLLENFVVFVGIEGDKHIFKIQKLIEEFTVVDGTHGIIVVESEKLKEIKDHGQITEATDFEKIIAGIPKEKIFELRFYRLTSFAERLLESSESNYIITEGSLFSRVKMALPTKAQDIGARIVERVLQKGKRAFLSIEEIATLTGRISWLKIRRKNDIIKEVISVYLKPLKEYGVIESYRQHGDGLEIQL